MDDKFITRAGVGLRFVVKKDGKVREEKPFLPGLRESDYFARRHGLRDVDLRGGQPRLTVEPCLDPSAMAGERLPRFRRSGQWLRLHLLSDDAGELVGHRGLRLEPLLAGLLQVVTDRLPIQSGLALDPPRALPCLSMAQHLSYVLHLDHPKAHATSRRPSRGCLAVSFSLVLMPGSAFAQVTRWPHDPGDLLAP